MLQRPVRYHNAGKIKPRLAAISHYAKHQRSTANINERGYLSRAGISSFVVRFRRSLFEY
jgi:hypothetical protein